MYFPGTVKAIHTKRHSSVDSENFIPLALYAFPFVASKNRLTFVDHLTICVVGMLCCARYSEDDMWYRAQVKTVEQEKPLEVRVVYVDYGTTEVVKTDR